MTTTAGNIKVWAALLVAAVSAAMVVAITGVALDAATAQAATATDATIVAKTLKVAPSSASGSGTLGEGYAVCPKGKRAVGGGVVQSGSAGVDDLSLNASGPLDNTRVTLNTNDGDKAKMWYGAVTNYDSTQRTWKVFAICSGTSNATIEAAPLTVQSNQTGDASAVCPAGRRALGGGVVQSGSATGINVSMSGPLDNTGVTSNTTTGDIAKRWYAAVHASGGERELKVFAICAGDSTATIKATPLSVSDGTHGEQFAECPGTKRALGGGMVQSGPANFMSLLASGPLDKEGTTLGTRDGDIPKQWYAAVFNESGLREFKVFAICE